MEELKNKKDIEREISKMDYLVKGKNSRLLNGYVDYAGNRKTKLYELVERLPCEYLKDFKHEISFCGIFDIASNLGDIGLCEKILKIGTDLEQLLLWKRNELQFYQSEFSKRIFSNTEDKIKNKKRVIRLLKKYKLIYKYKNIVFTLKSIMFRVYLKLNKSNRNGY